MENMDDPKNQEKLENRIIQKTRKIKKSGKSGKDRKYVNSRKDRKLKKSG